MAAVAAGGGGGLAVVAPAIAPAVQARRAVAAADTTVTAVAAPGLPTDPDELQVPNTCPAIASLRFLSWSTPANAARTRVPASELHGICLAVCSFNLQDSDIQRALRAANLIEAQLSTQRCSDILHELHSAGIFEEQYEREADWFSAVHESALINKNLLAFQPSWVVRTDPFDTPAQPAQPAVRGRGRQAAQNAEAQNEVAQDQPARAGPTELKFLQLTTWASILTEGAKQGEEQGPRALGRSVALLASRARDATRRDPASDIQAIALTLSGYVAAWASVGTAAVPSQLARHTAPYLVANMAVIPTDLCGTGGSADAYEMDLRDGHILLRGRESEAASVIWGRIHQNLDRFDVIGAFKGRLPNSGATKDVLERLFMGVAIPSGPPLVRTAELARELERRGKGQVISDLFAAGSSVSQVVEEILESHSNTAGSSTVPNSGDAGDLAVASSGVGGAGGGAMAQHEFDRAVTAPGFIEAYEKMKDMDGIEVLDAATTSGSVLMVRYVFMSPAWMRPRHAAFDILGKNIADRQSYLAYCSTVDVDTEKVPAQLNTYKLSEAQNDAFWSLRWDELDMVNATVGTPNEGGFLALRYLKHGTTYARVAEADFYTVEASLMGIKEWFGRLLIGVGFSTEPGEGTAGLRWWRGRLSSSSMSMVCLPVRRLLGGHGQVTTSSCTLCKGRKCCLKQSWSPAGRQMRPYLLSCLTARLSLPTLRRNWRMQSPLQLSGGRFHLISRRSQWCLRAPAASSRQVVEAAVVTSTAVVSLAPRRQARSVRGRQTLQEASQNWQRCWAAVICSWQGRFAISRQWRQR